MESDEGRERGGLDLCAGEHVMLSTNWGPHGRPGDEGSWLDLLPGAKRQFSFHGKSGEARIRGHGRDREPPSYLDVKQMLRDPLEMIREMDWGGNTQVLLLDDFEVADHIQFVGNRIRVDLLPVLRQIEASDFSCEKFYVSQLRREFRRQRGPAFLIYAPAYRESLMVVRIGRHNIVFPAIGARRGRQFHLRYYKRFGAMVDRELKRVLPDVVEHVKKQALRLEAAGATPKVLAVGQAHKDAREAMAARLAAGLADR